VSRGWRSLLAWSAAALLVALVAVTFVLWGTNGPAYIVDLIAAYCL
jgi:anti-sigma-K factor RskA